MRDTLPVLLSAALEGRLMFTDRAQLEAHQARLAQRQLRWLAAHSPYTAARFRGARLPLSAWTSLPPVGKADMMRHFSTLNTAGVTLEEVLAVARQAEASRDFSPLLPSRSGPLTVGLSSGTSGTQGVFLVSRAERLQWAGVVLRHLLPPPWPGTLLRRHRVAFLLRAESGLYRSVQGRQVQFRFLDLMRPVDELAEDLTRSRPTLLVGPPSVLRALMTAGAVASPERVVCVAEVLEDDDRQALTAHFGPVVQVYQATEGLLALPCPQGQLHLNEAHLHFDFEDSGGGHVRPVITDLRRRAQPFVRHRLDDLIVLGERCPCGLASRQLARVVGRQDDALLLPGPGGLVTVWPDFIRAAMNLVPGLREYRAEQTAAQKLHLSIDPDGPELRDRAAAELRRALQSVGASPGVTLEWIPYRPPDPGVKRRRVSRTWQPGKTR